MPLLHRVRIAELDACLPAGLLAELLRRVVGDAEKGATAIAGLRAGSDGLAAAAHKLRGAAGNLGLARVAAIAAEIEAAAREDREAAGAAERLAAAVAATRAALARPGSPRSGLSASSGRTGASRRVLSAGSGESWPKRVPRRPQGVTAPAGLGSPGPAVPPLHDASPL